MSKVFEMLESAVKKQFDHGELPEWLAEPAMKVAREPEKYDGKEHLVEILTVQILDYDVYAEAGCCKWAYDHEDIQRTLRWLEA